MKTKRTILCGVFAVILALTFTACDDGSGGGTFVAVTNITGVPATATAGTVLTLTGTVEPARATNKTIVWSVISGSAAISGNILNAPAAGTVIVRATITNGTARGTNYTKDFIITVNGGGNTHTHTYSTTWSYDATQHWKECTANDGAKTDVANHTGDPCNDCGYDSTATPVTFSSVTANGSSTATTTTLTLTFSDAIAGLSANDIALSGVAGVSKGTLGGTGPTYTLPISGFTAGGTLSVAVSKTGYNLRDSPKSVTIYYTDGWTWTGITIPPYYNFQVDSAINSNAIAYGDGTWVAVGYSQYDDVYFFTMVYSADNGET